jgi:hypothetical protein
MVIPRRELTMKARQRPATSRNLEFDAIVIDASDSHEEKLFV